MDTDNRDRQNDGRAEDLLDYEVPRHELFSLKQIVWTSILSGPLGTGYILVTNMKRLQKQGDLLMLMVQFVLLNLFLFTEDIIGVNLPIPGIVISLLVVLGTYYLAKRYMGAELEQHSLMGGRFASSGKVAVVIILSILLLVAFFAAMFALLDFESFKSVFDER